MTSLKKSSSYDKNYESLQIGNVPFVPLREDEQREYTDEERCIRTFVRMRIDFQKARIRLGNQIFQNFRMKLGLNSSEPTETNKEADSFLKQLKKEHDRLSDAIVGLSKKRAEKYIKDEGGVISSYFEYEMTSEYIESLLREQRVDKMIGKLVKEFPIWNKCMSHIVGLGPVIAGSILAFVDIHKSESVSAFWRYCGVDVRPNGQGASKMYPKKNEKGEPNPPGNYVIQEYINSKGELDVKKSLGYGTFLKSKLLGVLPGSILKQQHRPGNYYAPIFYNTRKMYQNHPNHSWKSPLHIQRMANRKMVQIMLMHIWICWRTLEGLDIKQPYHERVLGKTHKGETQEDICRRLYPEVFE